jgi:hypothetical protein
MINTTLKKKSALLAIILLLLIGISSSAQTIRYVDSTKADIGEGGTSWATASNNFQATVNASIPGDQVWVRKGTYFPESGLPFSMRQGIAIYGGFAGTEIALSQRNYVTNKTILKGNGNRVIYNFYLGLTNTAVLDGFTITGGSNSGDGGGMYNLSCSPTITNCTFSNNSSTGGDGGGMYNYSSSPIITNCIFNNNTVSNSGGFSGGAMHNEFAGSSPVIINCTFRNNTATSGNGGAISNEYATPNISNSTFNNNTGRYGAAIANNSSAASLNISNCIFKSNTAVTSGGGIYNIYGASPTINNCVFSNNTAIYGGGMYNYSASPVMNNCTFNNNATISSTGYGGGMYNSSTTSSLTITNCIFSYNSINGLFSYGAGMYNTASSPTIRNSLFSNNTTTYTGSGGGFGGGMCNSSSSPSISNCTFSNNSVTGIYGYGGAIYNYNSSSPAITNSILYGDTGGEIYNSSASSVVTYSNVQGGYTGTGNINANPLFLNAINPIGADSIWGTTDDGLRLFVCGPSINVGSNAAVHVNNTIDITGAPRIQQGIVDMGAYEGGELKTVTWLGLTENWATSSNWSSGIKPDACNHVIVNNSTTFMPLISGNEICYKLTVNNGAIVTFETGANLQIVGK